MKTQQKQMRNTVMVSGDTIFFHTPSGQNALPHNKEYHSWFHRCIRIFGCYSSNLTVNASLPWDESSEFMRTSPEFAAKPMGTYADPDKLVAARKAGMSFAELHRRAYAGEFPPSGPVDPRVLM